MDQRRQSPGLGPRHDSSSRVQKPETAAEKMAALKARVAAAVGTSKAKGGLNVSLHPALDDRGSWKPGGSEQMSTPSQGNSRPGSLGSSVKTHHGLGNDGRNDTKHGGVDKKNPYLDDDLAAQTNIGKRRESRRLIFNQKGKYIQQASALRKQAALEAMKKRIAEQTRRAGLDEDLDVEKNFAIEEPPGVEWWDEGLIDGNSYQEADDLSKFKITTPDTIVTEYIQHPVALEPPQDRQTPAAKPMFLTSKERAKLRRQRRMAELKEMQAKIRLGLVPAPPPKVKKGNLMRVLGDAAVKDPTSVEAQVNRDIAERHHKHVQANDERKLTKEQRRAKLAANQQKDAEKGIRVVVFKITSLANGQHRYKIGMNAEQLLLTGTCIMHPRFSLVIVEGGQRSINKYKKLMLNRIDWTENSPSRDRDNNTGAAREWLQAENQTGELKDMAFNECKLIFEGEEKARAFRKWGNKVCETDAEARELLSRPKMDSFWTLAKSFI